MTSPIWEVAAGDPVTRQNVKIFIAFIDIFKWFSITPNWFNTFTLYVAFCIFFGTFNFFLITALMFLGIWCFLSIFFGRKCFLLHRSCQILVIILHHLSVFMSDTWPSLCWTLQHQCLPSWCLHWRSSSL